jgi:pimeloyl-ACP methyl ester carboxylesterase
MNPGSSDSKSTLASASDKKPKDESWFPPFRSHSRLSVDELPLPSYEILWGRDCDKTSNKFDKNYKDGPKKIVLCHAWNSHRNQWIKTAHHLRDAYGHDVLIFDLYGHGKTEPLPNYDDHHYKIHVDGIEKLMKHTKFLGGPFEKLVLAGCSTGGGMAVHLAFRHPSRVERLVLCASAGAPEPFHRPSQVLCSILAAMFFVMMPIFYVLNITFKKCGSQLFSKYFGRLFLAQKAPRYEIKRSHIADLRSAGVKFSFVWGLQDVFHTWQEHFWYCQDEGTIFRKVKDQEFTQEDKDNFQFYPHLGHVNLRISKRGPYLRSDIWHGGAPPPAEVEDDAEYDHDSYGTSVLKNAREEHSMATLNKLYMFGGAFILFGMVWVLLLAHLYQKFKEYIKAFEMKNLPLW